jgi:hypothetical protein
MLCFIWHLAGGPRWNADRTVFLGGKDLGNWYYPYGAKMVLGHWYCPYGAHSADVRCAALSGARARGSTGTTYLRRSRGGEGNIIYSIHSTITGTKGEGKDQRAKGSEEPTFQFPC